MASETGVTTSGSAAVSRQPKPIRDLLLSEQFKAAVQAALPKHMKVERFVRVALNATMRQPDLLQCTQESFFRAMLDLSTYGLEADGRRAHLIPFWNNTVQPRQREVQLIIDYKGIAELVRRSGDVSYIHADVVYEHDEWDFSYGSGALLKHKPNMEDRGERVIAIYSFVKLRNGDEDFIVLSHAEVEKVRKRSKAANSGPWVTDWDEMAKKTAFRRHSKWLPLSAETRDAIEKDDEVVGFNVEALDGIDSVQASVGLDQIKASADENRGHDGATPTADASDNPSADIPIPEVTELPDAIACRFPKVKLDGVTFEKNEDKSAWRKAAAGDQVPPRRKNSSRSGDAFDFGGRQ